MSADRQEGHIAAFLRDGPTSAPESLLDAVLAHAEAHPRPRAWRFRGAILRLAPVGAVLVIGVVAVAVVPRLAAPATPQQVAAVRGTQRCDVRVAGARIFSQEGVDELRGQIEVCEDVLPDPRVAGAETRQVGAWLFLPDAADANGSSSSYGTLVIENEGGRWSGTFVGASSGLTADAPGRVTWIAIGSGGYRNLVYRGTATTADDGVRTIEGSVAPMAGPAFTASTWCWLVVATPDISIADAKHRDVVRDCTVTADDPRLEGIAHETRVIDVAPNGTTSNTGELSITTIDGGWRGTFSGTGNWYVPGRVSGELAGWGALEGQVLTIEIVSEDGMHGALAASVAAR